MSALDLDELRRQRGGQVFDAGRRWIGPGPGHSRADRSLSVMIADDGRALVHSFAGDPFRICADYLGLERARPASRADLDRLRAQRDAERRRTEAEAERFCGEVWRQGAPIEATPAETYLFRRGLIYEGAALRFHPAAPRSRDPEGAPRHRAMVAAVQRQDGRALGLHCTYITPDGLKASGDRSRLMFGRTSEGAVRLFALGPEGVLAVAEGIETALAFEALHGVPTWAALSTSGLSTFRLPPVVRRLIIAADSDDSGAGMAAARALAERASRSCVVQIRPAPEGSDWADVLLRGASR
jgi:hypothetical protein